MDRKKPKNNKITRYSNSVIYYKSPPKGRSTCPEVLSTWGKQQKKASSGR